MGQTQSVFASFAFGDIAEVAGEGREAILRDASDRKFDRDFSPVAAECIHLNSSAQYSRVAGSQVASEPCTVFLAERRRNDDISKRPAQNITPAVTECVFRCGVKFGDATFMVNRHYAIN